MSRHSMFITHIYRPSPQTQTAHFDKLIPEKSKLLLLYYMQTQPISNFWRSNAFGASQKKMLQCICDTHLKMAPAKAAS